MKLQTEVIVPVFTESKYSTANDYRLTVLPVKVKTPLCCSPSRASNTEELTAKICKCFPHTAIMILVPWFWQTCGMNCPWNEMNFLCHENEML